jgi:hypothetical protein
MEGRAAQAITDQGGSNSIARTERIGHRRSAALGDAAEDAAADADGCRERQADRPGEPKRVVLGWCSSSQAAHPLSYGRRNR